MARLRWEGSSGRDLGDLEGGLELARDGGVVRSVFIVFVLAGVGAWGLTRQLPAEAAVGTEQPAQEIQSVAIDGGRNLPQAALRAVLTTKVGDMLDNRRLERDRHALEAALSAMGYLAARAMPPSVTFGPRGGAYVVFDVDRGPMFHLRSITVTGPGQRDAHVVTLSAGDEASEDRLARARQSLLDTFALRGGKRVDLLVTPDFPSATVDVELATR